MHYDSQRVGQLQILRRHLTSVLLDLPIVTEEMSVATFMALLDHFSVNPDEYQEFTYVNNTPDNIEGGSS